MRYRTTMLALALVLLGGSAAAAQEFGVMESAEIIEPGNFKFIGYPVFVLDEDEAEGEVGFVLRGGYGFSERLDAELGVAFYEGATLLGGNLELGLLHSPTETGGLDLSARGGLHAVLGDLEDAVGFNLTGILSTHLTPNLEFVGALDYNQTVHEEVEDHSTLHLTPGVEYRVSRTIDLLADFGLGLTDESRNYFSVGISFYLR